MDHDVAAYLRAQLNVADVCDVVPADGKDLVHSLQLIHRPLRDQDGVVQDVGLRRHPSKLPGAKQIIGICKAGCDAQTAGLRADRTIDENDVPGVGIDLAVGQRHLQGNRVAAAQQVAVATRFHPRRERQVLLLADGEVNFDGIELRDRGQHRTGSDEIAHLHLSLPGDAVDQRANFGEADVQIRSLYLGLCTGYRCLVRGLRLDVIVELALGNGVRLRQGSITLGVDFGECQLSLCLGKSALRLIQHCLERSWINLEEDLILAHLAAFLIVLPDQVA